MSDYPPRWAWWTGPAGEVPLRHASRILSVACELEKLVYEGGPPLDLALRQYQHRHRSMGRTDRLILGTAVFSLARNRELIRRALPDATPGDGRLLRLALQDAAGADAPDRAEFPEDAAGGARAPQAPQALQALQAIEDLRRRSTEALTRAWDQPPAAIPADAVDAFAVLFSLPAFWLSHGPWPTLGDAVEELSRLKRPQSLLLRAAAHRASRDDVLAALRRAGIEAEPTSRSPWGIRIQGRHNVLATDLYRRGEVEIQDEGSQLVACLCDPRPNETVLDLCAGGGGKALALASAMGGRGAVTAHDTSPRRLDETRKRARRADLSNLRVVDDAERLEALGPFDLVLADVPCTSSGTLRRNPDVAWRFGEEDLLRLAALQAEILDRAAFFVKPSGHLIYSTCSVFLPENDFQVQRFLDRHPDFALAPPGDRRAHEPLLDVPGAASGAFRLPAALPSYDGDAFFMARWRRTKGAP